MSPSSVSVLTDRDLSLCLFCWPPSLWCTVPCLSIWSAGHHSLPAHFIALVSSLPLAVLPQFSETSELRNQRKDVTIAFPILLSSKFPLSLFLSTSLSVSLGLSVLLSLCFSLPHRHTHSHTNLQSERDQEDEFGGRDGRGWRGADIKDELNIFRLCKY